MVFSVSPSVTVREVDASAVIPAVSDSPAAIAGVFAWGPEGVRVLTSSEKELVSIFGKPSNYVYLDGGNEVTWSNQETFFVASDVLQYTNALYVTRVASGADVAADVTVAKQMFAAKYKGKLGNSISVAMITGQDAYSNELIAETNGIAGSFAFGTSSVSFTSDSDFITDSTLEIQAGDTLRVGNRNVGFQDLKVVSIADTVNGGDNTLTDYVIGFTSKYRMPEDVIDKLSFTRMSKGSSVVDSAPNANSFHVVVFDEGGEVTGTVGTVLEVFENLSTSTSAKTDDGTSKYFGNVIGSQSKWIKVSTTAINLTTLGDANIYLDFVGGSDGLDEGAVTLATLATGYDLYKEPDEIDVSFIVAGKSNNANLVNYLVANIADYRKDCVVYFSPRKEDVVDGSMDSDTGNNFVKMNNIIEFRNQIQNSSYWFMDSGYKYRYDRYNDTYCWIPLNGDVAGLCARSEVWESPAGYENGIIKNVVRLAYNPSNKSHRDQLYSNDVNPVKTQTGFGTLLFGDKTGLGRESAFNRINVRRLFITVEKAIATVSASFLFRSNDDFTQTQFKNVVEPYLRDIQGKRGIIDFRVVSDSTINTDDVIDQNLFRSNIFIKPSKSINNIELTFIATRTGVEFEEIAGQQF